MPQRIPLLPRIDTTLEMQTTQKNKIHKHAKLLSLGLGMGVSALTGMLIVLIYSAVLNHSIAPNSLLTALLALNTHVMTLMLPLLCLSLLTGMATAYIFYKVRVENIRHQCGRYVILTGFRRPSTLNTHLANALDHFYNSMMTWLDTILTSPSIPPSNPPLDQLFLHIDRFLQCLYGEALAQEAGWNEDKCCAYKRLIWDELVALIEGSWVDGCELHFFSNIHQWNQGRKDRLFAYVHRCLTRIVNLTHVFEHFYAQHLAPLTTEVIANLVTAEATVKSDTATDNDKGQAQQQIDQINRTLHFTSLSLPFDQLMYVTAPLFDRHTSPRYDDYNQPRHVDWQHNTLFVETPPTSRTYDTTLCDQIIACLEVACRKHLDGRCFNSFGFNTGMQYIENNALHTRITHKMHLPLFPASRRTETGYVVCERRRGTYSRDQLLDNLHTFLHTYATQLHVHKSFETWVKNAPENLKGLVDLSSIILSHAQEENDLPNMQLI